MSNLYHSLLGGALTQDWSATGLITTNDSWGDVPSIIGYLGDELTTATGVDPQTVLAEGTGTIDVIANQTNPNITNGGVAEFAITNPVVALQGSGTADAPFLLFHLDATGVENIRVQFNLRDIDGSADNAIQPIAVQYRIGTTGNFINLPAAYTADASSGPSLATLVTPVDVTLPPDVNNQSQVQVRVITTNAAGNDEWIGIDDIDISATPASGSTPIVSIATSDATASEASSDPGTFRISRTGDTTDALTVNYAIANGTGQADGTDYSPVLSGTATIAAGQSSVDLTITPVDDAIAEGDETLTLTLTDAAEYNLGSSTATVTIADNDEVAQITKIHTIQGNAANQQPNISGSGAHNDRSPIEGTDVTVEGVVVAVLPQLNGFFLQEEDADADGDSSTSEGIFVFTGSAPTVTEGNRVRVKGTVDEFFGMTQLDNDGGTFAVTVLDPDNNVAEVSPSIIELPATGDVDDYYEQYEGMRVQFADTLYVSEYFELARYGQIVLTEGDRPYQYTHIDNTPTATEYAAFLENLERRRIILDDDDNIQNSAIAEGEIFYPQPGGLSTGTQGTNYFRGGDSVSDLTGVLHWSFAGQAGTDAWRIRPTETNLVTFTPENLRPDTPPSPGGNIKVASFNVLNYFDSIDTTGGNGSPRGADSAAEFERQNAKLIDALTKIDADVFGLVEIENNGTAIQTLVNRLNTVLGSEVYGYIDTGVVGTDQITVAMIYKSAVVQPKGEEAILDAAAFTDPNGTGQQRSRPAIAQAFEVIDSSNSDFGSVFNVVVNHLKSKSPGGATGADLDQNDGQAAWNDTRTKAADYLVNTWIPSDPTGQGDSDYLIIGDLNAYKGETPITTIKNAGYTDLVEKFGGNDAYSYLFDGQLGYLDHALSSASLTSQVTGTVDWHINADEIPLFDYNDSIDDGAGEASFEAEPAANNLYEPNAFRTSDHDPVLIGLDLTPTVQIIDGTDKKDRLTGTAKNDQITGFKGNDTITTKGGFDRIVYLNVKDAGDTITDFEVGKDKLVLTQLLDRIIPGGYTGNNAIADGYVAFDVKRSDIRVIIDEKGKGKAAGRTLVTLENVSLAQINSVDNFVF